MYKVCSTSGCPHLVSSGSLCDECRKAKDKRRTRGRNPYTSKAHRLARARAGKGPAVRLSRRRAGRMRKAPCLCGAPSTIADHWPIERIELVEAGLDPTTRNACAACASAATTARPQGRNLQASTTGKTSADTHRLRHQNKTFHRSQADDASRSRRTTRKTKTTKSSRFDSRLMQQQASQTKTVAKQTEANRQNTHGDTP